MTYCLGILLPDGLVMASDSRTNAGVDQIATVCKLAILENSGSSLIAILSAGNLATSQAVVTTLREAAGSGVAGSDPFQCASMFDVARRVGELLRQTLDRDSGYVQPFGDPNASFIVGGQVAGEDPRLFQIYSAGNFVEATPRNHFLQIGETKYGKPILDRALQFDASRERAAKLALLSFDATIRSNLSVGPPIDVLSYEAGSFSGSSILKFRNNDPYYVTLREQYAAGLQSIVDALPEPAIGSGG